MKKAIILLLGICVMLLSCSKPDIDPNKDSTDNIELTLINTKESIEVDSGVNQVTLSFSTNHSWVATTEASWISLNPNKGNEGEISLVATVEENVADTDRSGVITIAAGNIKKNITIKQSLASNDITFAQGESLTYDISCERHSISIDFASSSTWIATTDADWLLLEPNFGKAGNNISVHVDVAANSSLESRTGIITLSAGKSHKNVTVKQAGIEETLSDELDDIFVAGDAILLPNETSECFAECCNKYGNIIENVDLIWESNKPSVATVNQDGKVTGIAEGIATITASSKDGTVSNYCTIYVADDFSTPVDLGLSVSWSRCDIGSNIPYVLGKLFFWGGATSQSESEWLYKNVPFNGGNREFSPSYWDSVKMSVVDDNNNLLRANDTATILLGDDWRMPKKEEFEELIDNCKIDRLYDGFIFVSKKDGHTDKWLFFNSHFDAKYDTADSYFSSTINENVVKFASGDFYEPYETVYALDVLNDGSSICLRERTYIAPVRPVFDNSTYLDIAISNISSSAVTVETTTNSSGAYYWYIASKSLWDTYGIDAIWDASLDLNYLSKGKDKATMNGLSSNKEYVVFASFCNNKGVRSGQVYSRVFKTK